MRELKFRVWDKQNARFYYSGIVNGAFGFFKPIDKDNSDIAESVLPDYNYIQQYTSFKDKNGNDIYEGDIVESYLKYEVIWSGIEGRWIIQCPYYRTYKMMAHENLSSTFSRQLKIIGNIFENPEFLHEQKTR